MQELNVLDTIQPGETGEIVIEYEGEEFARVTLKDIKKEKKVYTIVGEGIENIFRGIPDIEMDMLRTQTTIADFFGLSSGIIDEEKIQELMKDFKIFKICK